MSTVPQPLFATPRPTSPPSVIWVVTNNFPGGTIYPIAPDGTSAGSPITATDMDDPYDIAVVGSQIWVVNFTSGHIVRFSPDGSLAASTLTMSRLGATSIAVVASDEVWIASFGVILRYHFDGTLAGSNLSGNHMNGSRINGMALFETEVWVLSFTSNPADGFGGASIISRFAVDGTPLGYGGFAYDNESFGLDAVGTLAYAGGYTPTPELMLVRFDGSPDGAFTHPDLTHGCTFVRHVGSEIWALDGTTGVMARFTPTAGNAGPAITGPWGPQSAWCMVSP